MKTILITGASGFIATNFMQQNAKQYSFIKLSHTEIPGHVTFAELAANSKLQAQIDVILNLAGANIGAKRWSKARKEELLTSRINTTQQIVELFNQCSNKPHLISASAVGIYAVNTSNDETTKVDYTHYANFSQQITKQWELAALHYQGSITITRFGVVLSSKGGALSKILPLFKFCLGGKLGNGQQGFPWIALDDLLAALELIIENTLTGIFNLTVPQHITNTDLTKAIGKTWHRPTCFNLPPLLIKFLYGQMGKELLLQGTRVIPQRLIDLKFNYKYPDIYSCLNAIKNHQLSYNNSSVDRKMDTKEQEQKKNNTELKTAKSSDLGAFHPSEIKSKERLVELIQTADMDEN